MFSTAPFFFDYLCIFAAPASQAPVVLNPQLLGGQATLIRTPTGFALLRPQQAVSAGNQPQISAAAQQVNYILIIDQKNGVTTELLKMFRN